MVFPRDHQDTSMGWLRSRSGGVLPKFFMIIGFFLLSRQGHPEGPERHLDAARQNIAARQFFAAQLPRNCPHRGGNFEGGKNALSSGGEAIWEAFWETIWARAIVSQNCRETVGSQFSAARHQYASQGPLRTRAEKWRKNYQTHSSPQRPTFLPVQTSTVGTKTLTLSGTKIASQNRNDHGGRKRARNHSAAEIARFCASPATKKSLAPSDFRGPQNRRNFAATMGTRSRSRAILRPQRPRDTKLSPSWYTQICMVLGQRIGCTRRGPYSPKERVSTF